MNVDITTYAYISDGAAYCPGCAPEAMKRDPEVSRLYSWGMSEWADGGLYCDKCMDTIVEDESCPAGLCEALLDDHEDIIGNKYACPDEPRTTIRVVESIDGNPFNVRVCEEVVAGEGDEALDNAASHYRAKVVTIDIVPEEVFA